MTRSVAKAALLLALGSGPGAAAAQAGAEADSLVQAFWQYTLAGAVAGDSCLVSISADADKPLRESVRCPAMRRAFERAQEPAARLARCCAARAFVTEEHLPVGEAAESLLELARLVEGRLEAGRPPSRTRDGYLFANLRFVMGQARRALGIEQPPAARTGNGAHA